MPHNLSLYVPIEGHGVGLSRTEDGYCPVLADAVVTETVLFIDTWCHAAHGLYKFKMRFMMGMNCLDCLESIGCKELSTMTNL